LAALGTQMARNASGGDELGSVHWVDVVIYGAPQLGEQAAFGKQIADHHIAEAEALMVPENMVTTKDGLQEGMRLLIQDLIGLGIGYVEMMEDGKPTAFSKGRKMMYMLEFAPEPPRWVCSGSGNIAAIKKLNITK